MRIEFGKIPLDLSNDFHISEEVGGVLNDCDWSPYDSYVMCSLEAWENNRNADKKRNPMGQKTKITYPTAIHLSQAVEIAKNAELQISRSKNIQHQYKDYIKIIERAHLCMKIHIYTCA